MKAAVKEKFMSDLKQMLERFTDAAGRRRLIDAFGAQELVLSDAHLAQRFARAATLTALEKGRDLYVQGNPGKNSLYFLISGEFDLLINGVYIRTLMPGQMVGEFPIVDPGLPYAVTMRASDEVIVAIVSEDDFRSIAEGHPEIWKNMVKILVRRLYDSTRRIPPRRPPCVFIGHGRSPLWKELDSYISNELHIRTVTYETAGHAGESTERILEKMLAEATFAVLVLTAEDETAAATKRARQNVVHEAGLFQGVLGFQRAVMLVQSEIEAFSNVAGLRYIAFEGVNIAGTFVELTRALEDKGLVQRLGNGR
jgi:predicted nucleotide-binding protein